MVSGGNWEDTRSERKKDENGEKRRTGGRKEREKKKGRKENTKSGMLWLSLCTYTKLNTHAHRQVSAP